MRRRAAALAAVLLLPGAAGAAGLVAVAGEPGIHLYWGIGEGEVVVERATAGEPFRAIARVRPETDVTRARELLRAGGDEVGRALQLSDDFARRAAGSAGQDRGLALSSPGWARMRGAGWLDAEVEAGTTYRYRATRVTPGGTAQRLGEAEATAGRPATPAAPSPTARVGSREKPILSWFGAPFVAYRVERAASAEGPFTRLTALPIGAAEKSDAIAFEDETAPKDGGTLHYRVTPLDLLGRAGPASRTLAVRTPDRTPPAPPAGLVTRGVPGGLLLEWERSPEADLAGYHLHRTELSRATGKEGKGDVVAGERRRLTREPLLPAATRYEDRGATPGRVFRYEISAVDRSGNESPPSPPMLGAPKDETPPARVEGLRAALTGEGRVRLAWTPGREPDLWAYRVHHGVGDKGELRLLVTVEIGPGSGAEHVVALDPRAQEVQRFAVSAVDRTENEGPRSAPVEVRLPDRVAPGAPVIAGLDVSDGAVTVRWVAAADRDVAGWHVYRGAAGGALERLTGRPLDAPAGAWRDGSPPAGVALAYAVSAIDRSGNEGARSEARTTVAYRTARIGAPEGLAVRRWEGRPVVEWRPAPGARGTMIYRADAKGGVWRQVGGLVPGARLAVEPPERGSAWIRAQSVGRAGELSEPTEPIELRGEAPGREP